MLARRARSSARSATAPHRSRRREVAQAIDDALASQTPAAAERRARLRGRPARRSSLIETEGTDRKGLATDGEGTGVLVSDRGEVLTALHVVDAATTDRRSRFADGTVGARAA